MMKFVAQFLENMETPDGRPQGSTPPHPHSPRPYYTPIPVAPCIVGAGEERGGTLSGGQVMGPLVGARRASYATERLPKRFHEKPTRERALSTTSTR